MNPSSSAKVSPWVWVVIFAVHLATTLFLTSRHPEGMPDEGVYSDLGINLARGAGFHVDYAAYWHQSGQPYTHVGPGWPALLAVGYFLAGQTGLYLILGLVWCLNAWLVYRLGLVLSLTPRWAVGLAVWLTLNPFYLVYHGHLMTEALTLTFCLAIALVGALFLDSPRWSLLIGLAVVSALGHLVRSQVMLAAAAVWLVALFQLPWRRLIPYLFAFTVLHVLILAPWLWRMNEVGAGFTSTELKLGINIFQFGGSAVDDPYHIRSDEDWGAPAGFESMTPKERNAVLLQAGLKGIADRPGDYLRKCGRRVTYLLSPVPNFYTVGGIQYWGMLVATLLFFYSGWAAILARLFLVPRPLTRGEWVMVASLAVWYLFHFAVNGSVRNRLPSDAWCVALAMSLWCHRVLQPVSQPIPCGAAA